MGGVTEWFDEDKNDGVRNLGNHVGFSFNLLPVSISMGAMLVLTVLMKV